MSSLPNSSNLHGGLYWKQRRPSSMGKPIPLLRRSLYNQQSQSLSVSPPSSTSSLSHSSSVSSFESSTDMEFQYRIEQIKTELEARDRDIEIGYLLKRKSRQLSRQSSSSINGTGATEVSLNPAPMLSHNPAIRLNSGSSMNSTVSGSSTSTTTGKSLCILNLAKTLRSTCDRILQREEKFTIDSELLLLASEVINDVISKSPEDGEFPGWSDDENSILFLSDFLAQTPSLCLTRSGDIEVGSIDLTLFTSLEFLDLRKVEPQSLSGLNTIRVNLRSLKINRSIESLNEIFNEPGETAIGLTSVWPELTEMDLSFNQIKYIQSRTFEVTPAIEILNLSSNRISSIDAGLSRVLNSLTILNLNSNRLRAIPALPPNVKVLLLSNNYITSLEAGSTMGQLETFDISYNMIVDLTGAESLRELASLKSLFLTGNPITFTKNYRRSICSNLNRLVVSNKFQIDGEALSNSEVRRALEEIKRNGQLIIGPTNALRVTKSNPLTHMQSCDSGSTTSFRSSFRSKKPRTVKEVVVLDSENSAENETCDKSRSISSSENDASCIKDAVVNLIERHGQDNWLMRQSGNELKKLCNIQEPDYGIGQDYKTLLSRTRSGALSTSDAAHLNASADFDSAIDNNNDAFDSESESLDVITESTTSADLFYSCFDQNDDATPHTTDFPSETFTDTNGTAKYFHVLDSSHQQLVVSNRYLFEVNTCDQHIITKWDLKGLKDISEIKTDEEAGTIEIRLNFDTLRKQYRERSFVMSLNDYKEFTAATNEYLHSRTLQEFDSYQCLKCNSQFSRAMAETSVVQVEKMPREVNICPYCESELLVVMESTPLPNNESLLSSIDEGPSAWGLSIKSNTKKSPPIETGKRISLPGSGFFRACRNRCSSLKSQPESNIESSLTNNNYLNDSNAYMSSQDGINTYAQSVCSLSDIEILSCDSIEVVNDAPRSDDCGSDDVIEEGVEICEPDNSTDASTTATTMMRSNSSGSISTKYGTANYSTPIVTSKPPLPKPLSRTNSYTAVATATGQLSMSPPSNVLQMTPAPIKYDYVNYGKVDHRLQLFCELSVFKYDDEQLLALTKVVVITSYGPKQCIVIFSDKKLYIYKIVGAESDNPDTWLTKHKCFPINKLAKVDVLIGRHGVGLDMSPCGKYYAMLFRDSERTSSFIEFFLSEICMKMDPPCLVQDFSQTHKVLMSPVNPVEYFGVLRFAQCEIQGQQLQQQRAYNTSAVVLTNEELILVTDLSWLVHNRNGNAGAESIISAKHERDLTLLKQVESLEKNPCYLKLLFKLETSEVAWDMYFETGIEKEVFLNCLKDTCTDATFISLSQPIAP